MAPVLIITRPEQGAKRFLDQVSAALGHSPETVLSPLLQIVGMPFVVPPAVGTAIFTSENGVVQAMQGGVPVNLTAYCVGNQTAATARQFGIDVLGVAQDADALVDQLVAAQPTGPLTHFRGQHVAGDLFGKLGAAGHRVCNVICYDQRSVPLSQSAVSNLHGEKPVVLPLFSPRSATILKQQVVPTAPVWVIAMSGAVASAAGGLCTAGCDIAAKPDLGAMVAATCRRLQALENGRLA